MGLTDADKVLFPWGEADVQEPDAAASIDLTIWDTKTIVKISGMSENTTLNLTPDSELRKGSVVVVEVDQGTTGYNVILGTNIEGDDLSGVANDKDTLILEFDGSTFRKANEYKTVDAA